MTPNPIRKVLSTLRSHRVRFLLMGGQACVFYGAAEFSRDTDILLLAEPDNLELLSKALDELQASCIAVPPFSAEYLQRGHAVHFRCQSPHVEGIRIDVMSVLRGVAPFPTLWERRTTAETESGARYDLLSLPDLAQAKKTQRDKDWPMLRRLVESHFVEHAERPSLKHVDFWLKEAHTVSLLCEVAQQHPERASQLKQTRPLLTLALNGDEAALAKALHEEEEREREADKAYWAPLRAELETLRHEKLNRKSHS